VQPLGEEMELPKAQLLEIKTKQIFGKTFQKRLGVWAYFRSLEFTSHLEETSSSQTSS
jgi:hypothetical protein